MSYRPMVGAYDGNAPPVLDLTGGQPMLTGGFQRMTAQPLVTGGFSRITAQQMPPAAAPTCLTAAQVAAFLPCFTGKPPAGMTVKQAADLCAAAKQSGLFFLPYCPDAPRPPIPACADKGWLETLSYCERYPQYGGPNPALNALCWSAKKDPDWYSRARAMPPCKLADVADPGGHLDVPTEDDTAVDDSGFDLPADEILPDDHDGTSSKNAALWGDLLALLVVGGGGAYWYYSKHK